MSLAFSGTAQYLTAGSTPVTVPPFTMACWFKTTNTTNRNTLMALGASTNTTGQFVLAADGAQGSVVVAGAKQTSFLDALSTASYSSGVWAHACGVFNTTTDRRAFINGANKGTQSTSRVPASIDRIRIGAELSSAGASNLATATIAECAIWNVTLSDNEVARLATGVSPLRVRPLSLKFYAPLTTTASPAPDYTGGQRTLTWTGSPTLDTMPPSVSPRWGYEDGYQTGGWFPAALLNPPPSNSFSPNTGPTAGGTTITMDFGTLNGSITSVSFGGSLGTNITNVFGGLWQVQTPAHAAGAVNVSVNTTKSGTYFINNGFTFSDATGGGGRRMLMGIGG